MVLILPHRPRWVRDRDSTEFRALYLFVLSAGPTCCQTAVHSIFPPKMASFRFSNFSSLVPIKKKSSFSGNSSLRKRRGSLKEPSQPPPPPPPPPPPKKKKTLRTSPPQPWLDLSFLTAKIHQSVNVYAEQTNDLFIA